VTSTPANHDDASAATLAVEVSELGTLDAETARTLASYRQGDLLEGLTSICAVGPTGGPIQVPAPYGVVVVSQTCDIVLADRTAVHVARRMRLTDPHAREARDGKRPRFVHLPQVGEHDFADLDVLATVAKSEVASHSRLPGVAGVQQMRRFAGAVARKFGRFAFPDAVAPWLRPLEDVVASKSRKPNSPEGKAVEQVVELRVEAANGWGGAPYDLTLCVIVQPGTLPTFPDDTIPTPDLALNGWLYDEQGGLARSSAEIAARLEGAGNPTEKYWLWLALGDAWAVKCFPTGQVPDEVRTAVSGVVADVVPADEFPLTRVRRSEILDLDHLSAPTPELG